jgi:hypothetical protein
VGNIHGDRHDAKGSPSGRGGAGGRTAGDAGQGARPQSTISEHLRILKAAGIITGEIEGPRVCYALDPSALEPLRRFLDEIAGTPAGPAKTMPTQS